MKIAIITDNYLPRTGGVANVMVNVSNNLTKMGEEVHVLNNSLNKPEDLKFNILSSDKTLNYVLSQKINFYIFIVEMFFRILFSFKGLKILSRINLAFYYCFHPKNLTNRILSIKKLVQHIENHRIQVLLAGTAQHPLIYSFIISKWFKIPMTVIAHGDDYIKRYPLNINNLIFHNIEGVIVTNKEMRKLFLKVHKINPERVNIIRLGVDIVNSEVSQTKSELRDMYNISKEAFIILTVSRLYPRKGFETALKALKTIISENPDLPISYFIIGSGSEQQKIEKLIGVLELKNHVKLLGFVDEVIKNHYYKMSDIFILVPEIKKGSIEGFGIVYIEANFFKLPTIGSRSGGVKVAVEDGKNGYLIEPNDEKNLKEKILFLYNNEKIRNNFGNYGHSRVKESFDWKINATKYRDYLKKVIKSFR